MGVHWHPPPASTFEAKIKAKIEANNVERSRFALLLAQTGDGIEH
jgi:hypothetical protein